MTLPFVEQNAVSRQRLEAVVRGLSDRDLARATPEGWTVAALLAHMAYWDQRMIVLLRRWREKGVEHSPVDADAVNDALLPLCLRLSAQAAIELCLSTAAQADAELARLSPDLIRQIEASGTHFRINRSLHRDDHLNQIERLIGARA